MFRNWKSEGALVNLGGFHGYRQSFAQELWTSVSQRLRRVKARRDRPRGVKMCSSEAKSLSEGVRGGLQHISALLEL